MFCREKSYPSNCFCGSWHRMSSWAGTGYKRPKFISFSWSPVGLISWISTWLFYPKKMNGKQCKCLLCHHYWFSNTLYICSYIIYINIIYIYICTPFPRVWTERRLFTSHSWESNALLSPRGGNTLRRKKCWCWCCVGDDGDNEEDDDDEDDEDEDEEDDDDNDNDDFHDDEDAEGQEELNTIGCVPLQRFHPCFENPSHADEGANSAVSLVAKSISRWGWSVYLWQVYHNQSFTSAKMLKNVWWCMQKLWLTVNPYKSWGPRSLAKLIYNSNNYGLWYL